MTDIEFHKQRRMFVIFPWTLYLAPEECPLSHREWFSTIEDIDPDEVIETKTRGYVDKTGVYAYRGTEMVGDAQVEHDIKRVLPELIDKIRPLPTSLVWVGIVKGEPGERWKGARLLY
jgi:hypothetical protein